jgi:isoamylase
VILNAYWESLKFELPAVAGAETDPWCRWIDTSLESPPAIVDWHPALSVPGWTHRAGSRSVVVLWGRLDGDATPAF